MTDYQIGDEVEVVVKGKVRQVDANGIDINPPDHTFWVSLTWDAVDRVKVIKRALPKVGDVVRGRDAIDLPVGTVLRHELKGYRGERYNNVWVRYPSGWHGAQPRLADTPAHDLSYKVLYLPEN